VFQAFFQWLFLRNGWTMDMNLPPESAGQAVMLAAPHTTNWDFVYAMAAFRLMGLPVRFAAKSELRRIPFIGWLVGSMGAVWIDRSANAQGNRPSYVDAMANLFKEHPKLIVLLAPEGTRSRVTKWKTGFFYIAEKAGVPILTGYLDYEKKAAGVGPAIHPADGLDVVMQKVTDYYRNVKGKFPKNFAPDERYA
jgi:1-acyl-sn-glycerol-3-phosphate acyltransferase